MQAAAAAIQQTLIDPRKHTSTLNQAPIATVALGTEHHQRVRHQRNYKDQ